MSNKKRLGATTSKTFVATGTTKALVDGHPRDITLVAVRHTEVCSDVLFSSNSRTDGNVTTTVSKRELLTFTRTTLSLGLAIVSPVDKKFTEQLEAARARGSKAQVELMLQANSGSEVTYARGVAIATGKAMKARTALATITTDEPFFGKTMVDTMLKQKLKEICEDPDRFVKVTPVAVETKELARENNITLSEPRVRNKHAQLTE